jgi:phosphoribosyl-dephospho-CoA transferase
MSSRGPLSDSDVRRNRGEFLSLRFYDNSLQFAFSCLQKLGTRGTCKNHTIYALIDQISEGTLDQVKLKKNV